jgi:hypothetical protein
MNAIGNALGSYRRIGHPEIIKRGTLSIKKYITSFDKHTFFGRTSG